MLAHLMDLGDGAIAVNLAKKILLDAGGAVPRCAGRVGRGRPAGFRAVSVEQLQQARAELRGRSRGGTKGRPTC